MKGDHMLVSERKRQANRLNAQKSTGPRSAEGKDKVSQNALTHGLTAEKHTVLPGEDAGEYDSEQPKGTLACGSRLNATIAEEKNKATAEPKCRPGQQLAIEMEALSSAVAAQRLVAGVELDRSPRAHKMAAASCENPS